VPPEATDLLCYSTFVFWMKNNVDTEQAILSGANPNNDHEILIRLKSGNVINLSNHTNGD
jgi:hypothetical protein